MWRMLHLSRVSAPSHTDIRHFLLSCEHSRSYLIPGKRYRNLPLSRTASTGHIDIRICQSYTAVTNSIILSYLVLRKSFSRGRIIIDRTPKYFGCLLERKRKSQFCWQEFYRDYSEQIFILNLIRGVAGQVRWPRFFTNRVSNYSPL